MTREKLSISPERFFIALLAVCLLPWLCVQLQLSLNGDTVWLLTATERFLNGEPMLEAFYTVNPPLSILYHIPPVLLGKVLPVPQYYIVFLYFVALACLSATALNAILKRWDGITESQRHIIIAAFLAGSTVMPGISLGEREPVVLLGLMPFLALQLSMGRGIDIPSRIKWPVLILGTIAVLIKPHFGLLPTLVLADRFLRQKKFFGVLRDPDFLCLAIGTLSYIAVVVLFFRDYIDVILPDVVALYVANKDFATAMPELFIHFYLIAIIFGVEGFLTPLKGRQKQLLVLLYAGALLSLIPFAVQMKGYYYQILPAEIFFLCALSLSAHTYLAQYLSKFRFIEPLTLLSIFALVYIYMPPNTDYPQHRSYNDLPLSAEIGKICPDPCRYFIFNNDIEIMHTVSYYKRQQNASRFPTFWFLPGLVRENPDLDEQQRQPYIEKYARMVAEDLKNYSPDLLVIGRFELEKDGPYFDFPSFFNKNADFRQEWATYSPAGTVTIDKGRYFGGTFQGIESPVKYDFYLKK